MIMYSHTSALAKVAVQMNAKGQARSVMTGASVDVMDEARVSAQL
jgi:hypothetical protein